MKRPAAPPPDARSLALGGLVAALYIALTAAFAPLSFGEVQFRVSEALTLLPVLFFPAVPGLFAGCLLANLLLGAPWQDVVFGSLATLLAAVATRALRGRLTLAALMPVVSNGLIVGATLSFVYRLPLAMTVLTVSLGEAGVCFLLGVPLVRLLRRRFGEGKLPAR